MPVQIDIAMPKSCKECRFCLLLCEGYFCIGAFAKTDSARKITEQEFEKRPKRICPLKECEK